MYPRLNKSFKAYDTASAKLSVLCSKIGTFHRCHSALTGFDYRQRLFKFTLKSFRILHFESGILRIECFFYLKKCIGVFINSSINVKLRKCRVSFRVKQRIHALHFQEIKIFFRDIPETKTQYSGIYLHQYFYVNIEWNEKSCYDIRYFVVVSRIFAFATSVFLL